MQIIHHMTIDMAKPLPVVPVSAVQGDGSTRVLRLTLLENGEPWAVPQGITAAVAFRKSDGTKGLYDTLPDGSKAVTIDGSAVTAVLAPQVLSCPGEVSAAVAFYDSRLSQLATFPFNIRVEKNPAAGQEISNDYYRFSTMEAVSEAVEGFLQAAQKALETVHDTASEDAPAIVCEAIGEVIHVADAAERPLKCLTLYGKTTQNGTPTPSAPVALESVGAGGAIHTTVAGKNLISPDAITITLDKKYIEAYRRDGLLLPAGTYTFSSGGTPGGLYLCDKSTETRITHAYAKTLTFTLPEATLVYMYTFNGDGFADGDVGTLQLEVGSTATTCEPYKGQVLTVSTPNGLPGIPVSGGGNYTDENGQQWICDKIDFARGVYIKRLAWIDSYAGQEIAGVYLSTTGALSGGAGVLCALPVPTETPLSGVELAVFASLHSNKPNTTAFNDSGAGMKLSYVADTKTYIDQKLAVISKAILS